jgi:glucokinase
MSGQPGLIAGLDIGGTKVALALIDAAGAILARDEFPTDPARGFAPAMDELARRLARLCAMVGSPLLGIGIACTGPVDPARGEIGEVEFLPGWRGCNPVANLAARFGVTASMENDADAAVLGEAVWGAAKGCRSVISVTVGTGIGGGVLLEGRLYRGVQRAHPEIGHHVIDATGPPCFCGACGCWEVLASGPAMVKRYRESNTAPPLELSARSICEAARRGEPAALRAVESEARYLGIGLANLVTLFTPEMIVLSGSVMESADLFLPRIRSMVDQCCALVPADQVRIVRSALGRDAPLIGASVVWSDRQREGGRL